MNEASGPYIATCKHCHGQNLRFMRKAEERTYYIGPTPTKAETWVFYFACLDCGATTKAQIATWDLDEYVDWTPGRVIP